jgi:2-polyprenyl-3-methyl-5-hydroxy-6-metoxy-1,4-benzoquinol methylase
MFFDVVLALDVIEHIENPDHMLCEIHRVIKKSGVLIVSSPNVLHGCGSPSTTTQIGWLGY